MKEKMLITTRFVAGRSWGETFPQRGSDGTAGTRKRTLVI